MNNWKVIEFNPFTHEITSRHDKTGELLFVTIPPGHRTLEKSAAFLEAWHRQHTSIEPQKTNIFKYLFVSSAILLIADVVLRCFHV